MFLAIACACLPALRPAVEVTWVQCRKLSSTTKLRTGSDAPSGGKVAWDEKTRQHVVEVSESSRSETSLPKKPHNGVTTEQTPTPNVQKALQSLDPRFSGPALGNDARASFESGRARQEKVHRDAERGYPLPNNAISVAKGFSIKDS